ncbi:condensation domain-containing protein [Mycobacteroides chelonae]|jgi:hypothetical protein|uniref:Acyltransferase n=1 Tax=Mycobacteroides chelonae TaxID=1774 RepID=A0AB73M4F1_MYCCH|nr:condensation domain-containing protein [Mycobacteroides chelonae]MBF9326395.1 acyltransferase [Mycobacteroides chelonae]MBF9352449.1 acyltransferase [Mycobacteroides chelonae]MBF9420571.1 acyltransferase [Mycobacteroides chelonae]MBF9438768.1 acyltransferase [Mycobacteroides chelonae]MBV6360349.1 acyltransferase [Mycobacteroides chelonae]
MRGGPVTVSLTDKWEPSAGSVITWQPSPASYAKALEAPVSEVPPSFMQVQHLRTYLQQAAKGLDFSRVLVFTLDMPGRCDKRAMGHVINAHLRRHDTYRSWFSLDDDQNIVRRTIADPADVEFVQVKLGEMTSDEVREMVVSETPDPFRWDCFRFGIVQSSGHFTFYFSVDHLHLDATFARLLIMEILMGYKALVQGGAPIELPPAGSYGDYCIRQHEFLSGLTPDSEPVREWTQFAENNRGSLPDFPLPLGDHGVPCGTAIVTEQLLDEQQALKFESRCIDAGARFIGGVMAALGFAERELTGTDTYYGITPSDARDEADMFTTGWFTGLVPITAPVDGTFGAAAVAAQESFDRGRQLVNVPFYRVLELVPELNWPRPYHPMINFFDGGAPPLSQLFTNPLLVSNPIGLYAESKSVYQLTIFISRFPTETTLMIAYPDNPIARESITRYVDLVKSTFAGVCEQNDAVHAR